jgi:predicted ATP-dependent endonuclease of OLD family
MITSIKLQNFRAFQSEVAVRIRPITVLIGKNSAGKSSLIKFLLMLKQTLASQADTFFVTEGDEVHLGTWADLRHSNTRFEPFRDKYLKYSIDTETDDLPPPEVQQMWNITSKNAAVVRNFAGMKVEFEIVEQPVRKKNPKGRFTIDGRLSYGSRVVAGHHQVRGVVDERLIFLKSTRNVNTSGFLRFSRQTESIAKLLEASAAEAFLEPLRYQFISARHLSPIREESQQVVQAGSPPPGYVGHKGEYAMPHLARLLESSEKANLVEKFALKVARVEAMKSRSAAARLFMQLRAINAETGASCLLADFGFGVSQCLPIFIQGAMHDPHQLLIVEQPEAQLHPTAQLELGSFFAELWQKHRVPSLIETHSGNILLRLRKLVARGALRPEDISIAYFTIEDVKQKNTPSFKSVVVKNLDIRSDGSLEKGLPMEFFGADILEALEMKGNNARA